jgi:hypothetical protein
VILESGTGTGKTTCVAKNIASFQLLKPEITLLSITNLISLSNQQVITFHNNKVQLSSYLDDKVNPTLMMMQNSVICINSLYKLSDCDFTNKILYMDEIHSLCNALTHNDKIHHQKLVVNTLLRALKTCYKIVVSDAHIYNNTMTLLQERMNDGISETVHYVNVYNKFEGVKATKYQDENVFYETIKSKIQVGDSFSFACDSKSVITKWFDWMWAEANVETQSRMILYTSETDSTLCNDWKNKIIFYSPKISTGGDVTILDQTEQFVYITGKSVSSITLYQMATRTRNMSQLSYYSCAGCTTSKYENIEDCTQKNFKEFAANCLGRSSCVLDSKTTFDKNEDAFFHMYCENIYVLDLFKTNTLEYFEQELKHAGFTLSCGEDNVSKLDNEITEQMKTLSTTINNEKYDLLISHIENNDEEIEPPIGIVNMLKRTEILHLTTTELIQEYRDIVEDEYKMEHFLNYNRLTKSFLYCENKLNEVVNSKMLTGIQSNVWNKIKYIHMLAQSCGIQDTLLDLDKVIVPDIKNKKVQLLIETIKVLYNKRDKVKAEDYTQEQFVKLYKFMLDNLIKNLGIIVSTKSTSGITRNKHLFSINDVEKSRYDRLIAIMNPNSEIDLDMEEV